MGKHKANKTRANSVKKMISASHPGLKANKAKNDKKGSAAAAAAGPRHQQQVPTSMFFAHNTALGPPYHVIVDTNFINFAIKNKIELVRGMMDCLLAKCIPVVLDSVMAELEKLGHRCVFERAAARARSPPGRPGLSRGAARARSPPGRPAAVSASRGAGSRARGAAFRRADVPSPQRPSLQGTRPLPTHPPPSPPPGTGSRCASPRTRGSCV